jgi:hypothetical protein
VGCLQAFRKGESVLRCHFALKSFPLNGALQGLPGPRMSVPCQSRYHVSCFRLTKPFQSRLKDEGGLSLPAGIASVLPIFICECCTVRSVLGRELTWHPRDRALMLLERARILDMVHQWAPSTISQYKGKIRMVKEFELLFRCPVLRTPNLTAPPNVESIPLMWAQQRYSLQQRQWRRSTALIGADEDRVTFSTVRMMRSATSLYHTWMKMVEQPGQLIREHGSSRPIQVDGCIPTDGLEYSLMSTGMSRRLGENAKPSQVLLGRHIEWMDNYLNDGYLKAIKNGNLILAHELAKAGGCNLLAWLAWLRGGETFGLRWMDIECILPGHDGIQDLPGGVGALLFRLLEQTKTNRSSVADVITAFCTGSGLHLGKWIKRMRAHVAEVGEDPAATEWPTDARYIFDNNAGIPWDSAYFRHCYLLPLLQLQRLNGDAYLQEFDGSPGKTLMEAFYSMHSYRRGGRSHVSKHRPGCRRKATPEEVNEHGRWRRRRASESMAEQYRQWPLIDRLALTLLCM